MMTEEEKNRIRNFIKDVDQYDAHIRRNEEGEIIERESLWEHTERSMKYFRLLWEEKNLDDMFARFCKRMLGDVSQECMDFLKNMTEGLPMFHDMGKINPKFQRDVMKNEKVEKDKVFACVGKRHSLISAVLYTDYYLEQVKLKITSKEEKGIISPLVIYHAYVIGKHHSNLDNFEKFVRSLAEETGNTILEIFRERKCGGYQKEVTLKKERVRAVAKRRERLTEDKAKSITLYGYVKLMYSLLVASDYYAAAEFMSGVEVKQFGNLDDIEKWREIYENTELVRQIRRYQEEGYPRTGEELKNTKDINLLRTELLLDAEYALRENSQESIIYVEAPTGSGKSNIAMDLSLWLMKSNRQLRKVYEIYPFNTLVEQNIENLKKVFGENEEVFENIAVVNSLTPIKTLGGKGRTGSEQPFLYQEALLSRQFLNYPFIVSTHVSLFDTMFGDTKESAFGFHQLMNSVIILDEIQSYKYRIWGEIISFLRNFSELLNLKIIIMSATLPNMDLLYENGEQAFALIKNREKYFCHPCFQERVKLSYELLDLELQEEGLLEHVVNSSKTGRKILVEFIKKKTAFQFFVKLKEREDIACGVEYMSGDDNLIERNRILSRIKNGKDAVILVATQVIEAGVDIDMDIGYKNISKLDSEEQFLGRINRSCIRSGKVYFFQLDCAKQIYKDGDKRIDRQFTLENKEMREVLEEKKFSEYYKEILEDLRENQNESSADIGLYSFFREVGELNWGKVRERMKLIEDDTWSMSVYLSRVLTDECGNTLDGAEIWESYVSLLKDFHMDYAKKKVKLSAITSKMNYFIYQVKQNPNLSYHAKVGEIYYIEDGEKYFEDGKLNRQKVEGKVGAFVDFI